MTRPLKGSQRKYKITAAVSIAALSTRAWENYWGSVEQGRRAWQVLREDWNLGNAGRRPAPFWRYEPDVPAELRGDGSIEATNDAELHARRKKWLVGPGSHHLRPGEDRAIRENLSWGAWSSSSEEGRGS